MIGIKITQRGSFCSHAKSIGKIADTPEYAKTINKCFIASLDGVFIVNIVDLTPLWFSARLSDLSKNQALTKARLDELSGSRLPLLR